MSATARVRCQQSAGVLEQDALLRQGYGGHAGVSRFSMGAGARVSWELGRSNNLSEIAGRKANRLINCLGNMMESTALHGNVH